MSQPKAISIELGPQHAILQRQLETGHYENASEVLRDALKLMESRDAVFDDWLREEVRTSLGDKRPSVPVDDVFRRLEARHTRRMKATKRDA